MKPGTALAALLADPAEAFGKPGDQTALVLSEDARSGRVIVLMSSGPEHDAAVAACQPKPRQRGAAA